MLQEIAVAVIVTAAALFALWRVPGTPTRLRYVAGLRRIGLTGPARFLERRVMRSIAGGGCQACGSATQRTVHGGNASPRR